jgi:hypothetical protein
VLKGWKVIACVAIGLSSQIAHAELNLAPCDTELNAEVQKLDAAVATIRSEWQAAAASKIASAGLSERKRLAFEKSYADEIAKLSSVISKNLEVIAKLRMPLVQPAYSPVLCERLSELRKSNDQVIAGYRQMLQGLLEVLDDSLTKEKK